MATRVTFGMLRETLSAWNADKAPRLAAAIAYSTMFAIAPLLIITIAVVGAVLGFTGSAHPHTAVENALLENVSRAAGSDAAQMVRGMVDASFGKPRQGIIAQVIGWIVFIVGASSLFVALQDSLNTVWGAKPPEKHSNILVMLRDRVATLVMVLVIGLLLVASFLLNVVIAYVTANMHAPGPLAAINWLVSIVVLTILFALMFRILPDVDIRWADVGVGAACTAVLFVGGQALIGLYLGRTGATSAYGAAGALLAVLVWVYYSAAILLLGAEFTKIHARRNGSQG